MDEGRDEPHQTTHDGENKIQINNNVMSRYDHKIESCLQEIDHLSK